MWKLLQSDNESLSVGDHWSSTEVPGSEVQSQEKIT
jgi:hypothetical protein